MAWRRNRLVMARLARSLGKVFGVTVNWGYRSLWSPLERHGRELAGLLRKLEKRRPRPHPPCDA